MDMKLGYKQTEIGIIPVEWNVTELGQCLAARPSYGINAAAVPYSDQLPVFLRITDIADGQLVSSPRVSVDSPMSCNYFLSDGDIVFARTGASVGKSYKFRPIDGPLVYAGFLIRVRANPEKLLPDFLAAYAATGSYWRWVRMMSMRSGQPGINAYEYSLLPVPVPSSSEQRAIGAVLSDVDALLGALDRLIAKKLDIKQAAMRQLLTGQTRLPGFHGEWGAKRIGEFADCTAGGTPSTRIREYWGGEIRWMSSGELNLKRVYEVEGRITEAGLNNSSTRIVPAKSVLIGLAGQGKTRGTVAMNLVELCTNQSIAAVLPNASFVPEYLYFNLDSRYDELRELSSGDGGRGGLNLTLIKSLAVPFPPVIEQAAIASVLSDMDSELSALEARRDKIRSLKQGMMQELLTGRTRLVKPELKLQKSDVVRTRDRRANVYFRRTVLAAEIIDRLHTEPTFGHVKFEKVIFLVEHLCKVETGSNYRRNAAGPYDNRAIRSIDSQLRTQKWFDARNDKGRYRYVPMENHGGHNEYFERYFSGIRPTFESIIDTFKTVDTERCEIVATLFGAWNDLIKQHKVVSDEAILHDVLNEWHETKKRIPEDRWRKALGWMRAQGFVPDESSDRGLP